MVDSGQVRDWGVGRMGGPVEGFVGECSAVGNGLMCG